MKRARAVASLNTLVRARSAYYPHDAHITQPGFMAREVNKVLQYERCIGSKLDNGARLVSASTLIDLSARLNYSAARRISQWCIYAPTVEKAN